MTCTECGQPFTPSEPEEEICGPCQLRDHPERDRILAAQEPPPGELFSPPQDPSALKR